MAEKKLTVTLVRSAVTQVKKDQTATCRAMGLRKIGDSTIQTDNAQTKGKIAKIGYLLQVTEVE